MSRCGDRRVGGHAARQVRIIIQDKRNWGEQRGALVGFSVAGLLLAIVRIEVEDEYIRPAIGLL